MGNRTATILIVAIGLFAVFWTGWWSIELRTEQRVAEYYEGRVQSQEATSKAIERCIVGPEAERAECIQKAVANEERRDYEARDLYAQEWMALWAFLMFLAALFSTITSLYGVVLLYATLKATRETVAAALADQRPWLKLTLSVIDEVAFDGKDVRVSVLWKVENVGRSPATFLNVSVSGAPFAHSQVARQSARRFAENFASLGFSNQSLTLFPNDSDSGIYNLPLDPQNIDEIMRDLPERGDFLPEICAFAAYRMSRHGDVMVTNMTVSLERNRPDGLGFNIKELPLSAGDFVLRRSLHTEHAT